MRNGRPSFALNEVMVVRDSRTEQLYLSQHDLVIALLRFKNELLTAGLREAAEAVEPIIVVVSNTKA